MQRNTIELSGKIEEKNDTVDLGKLVSDYMAFYDKRIGCISQVDEKHLEKLHDDFNVLLYPKPQPEHP